MEILDSHVHFVDPLRPEGIDWPDKASPLHRRFEISDLIDDTRPLMLSGCVLVETGRRPADDKWLLDVAAHEPLIRAVVLNLQPDLEGFDARLENALDCPAFAGVRLRPIQQYDLASSSLKRAFRLLEKSGKTVEFGAKSKAQKKTFAGLARTFPSTRWILDHSGHPSVNSGSDADWIRGIAEIAEVPNTLVKFTQFPCVDDDWRPIVDVLVAHFGTARILYGSNWPVCTLSPWNAETIHGLETYFGPNAPAVFHDNAAHAYRIVPVDAPP